jgi:hypothetical protein
MYKRSKQLRLLFTGSKILSSVNAVKLSGMT